MSRTLDIVVLSDLHLGSYSCHVQQLLKYLRNINPKTLVLNGDIIDFNSFKKRSFPPEHLEVIQRILNLAATGTKVYYITGNHDDVLRRYTDFSVGNLHLRDKLVLQLKGKKYWFFHGDIFDIVNNFSPAITRIGSGGYNFLLFMNRFINRLRKNLNKAPMSFAQKLKRSVSQANDYIEEFEKTAIRLAQKQEYDYVVCGHIHQPKVKTSTEKGKEITYMNAGDWVENLTALEYKWNKWSIYKYNEADFPNVHPRLRVRRDSNHLSPLSAQAIFSKIVEQP